MPFFTERINAARPLLSTSARRRVTFGSLAFLLAFGLAQGSLAAPDLSWDRPSNGLAVTVWDPGTRCGGQVPALLVVKLNPERLRFSVYYFRDEGLAQPLILEEWQRRTEAMILFNAGLFQKDYSYMGLLVKDGRSLESKPHPRWKGLFVAEPTRADLQKARVMDLSRESFAAELPPYREAAQSLMLLDASGKPRVRQSDKRAHQTVVGEDLSGHILVIKTAQVVTMWDLALCLRKGIPDLRHAMAMDGGSSSDVLFSKEVLPKPSESGEALPWSSFVDGSGSGHIPLPTVIGVTPRGNATRLRTK